MDLEPIAGKPVRFPPGRLAIRLSPEHRLAYRTLYARYQSFLTGLPVLHDRDLDGREVTVTPRQLEALNTGFAKLSAPPALHGGTAFGSQEAGRNRLFKRLQYLS